MTEYTLVEEVPRLVVCITRHCHGECVDTLLTVFKNLRSPATEMRILQSTVSTERVFISDGGGILRGSKICGSPSPHVFLKMCAVRPVTDELLVSICRTVQALIGSVRNIPRATG